jgi:mutator protein MutT
MAGSWEFPGGKVEGHEQPLEALARELREELGIEIGPGPHRPLRRISHSYADRGVLIDVWIVRGFTGLPRGLEGQALRWCTVNELERTALLPADKPIISALRLPAVLVEWSTDDYTIGTREAGKTFGVMCDDSEAALAAERSGADFVAMRPEMPTTALSRLSRALLVPLFAVGISLDDAWRAGASGIHAI